MIEKAALKVSEELSPNPISYLGVLTKDAHLHLFDISQKCCDRGLILQVAQQCLEDRDEGFRLTMVMMHFAEV